MPTSDLNMLIEMGFDEKRAKLAIAQTGNLNGAIEWLGKNQDKTIDEIEEESKPSGSSATNVGTGKEDGPVDKDDKAEDDKPGEVANSFVCDECGKYLPNSQAAANHARHNEGHDSFSESNVEIPRRTLEELKKMVAEKKAQKEAEQKEATKLNEQLRRKRTQEAKEELEALERKKLQLEAARTRKEKEEYAKHEKRVKAEIQAAKEERQRKAAEAKARRQGQLPDVAVPPPTQSPAEILAATASSSQGSGDVRLKLMINSKSVLKRFPAQTTLREVVEALQKDGSVQSVNKLVFKLAKKQFEPSQFGQTLQDAGMAPSAIIDVE